MAKKKKLTYAELARIVCELESRCVWAINFLHCRGSGMVATRTKDSFKSNGHWTHWFADGIEMVGLHKIVNRELLTMTPSERDRAIKSKERQSKIASQCQP